ncbi:MAG: hypothetical protein JRJ62_12020 [Deltaproteobacteria bacterium]|nr:hypothetical protein [Deltaproteobacteria bacterium]
MNLWEIFSFIMHLPLEVVLFLIIFGICEFAPVFIIAYLLKKHMRVGKLDLWMTSFLYVIVVFFALLIIDVFLPDNLYLAFITVTGGLWISFFFLGPIFNAISLDARKLYIFHIDLDSMPPNIDPHYAYIYEIEGREYVVEIDSDGYEPIWAFLKRLFNRKTRYVCEGVRLSFSVLGVYEGIFAKDLQYRKIRDERGKLVKALVVEPVESHKFNEVQFATQLIRFKDMKREIENAYEEITKYERQMFILARYEARKMVLNLQKAVLGDIKKAYDDVKTEMDEDLEELNRQVKQEQKTLQGTTAEEWEEEDEPD